MNTETLATKLYWLRWDAYTQMSMGNDEPVEAVSIEMADGSVETAQFATLDGNSDNPLAYSLFFWNKGYQRIAWEETAWFRSNVLHQ